MDIIEQHKKQIDYLSRVITEVPMTLDDLAVMNRLLTKECIALSCDLEQEIRHRSRKLDVVTFGC